LGQIVVLEADEMKLTGSWKVGRGTIVVSLEVDTLGEHARGSDQADEDNGAPHTAIVAHDGEPVS
jgi:hypothetical protein